VTSNPQLKRYELFGWDYPLVAPLTDEEVAWYELWARRTGSPVLALACGTARLLCRLAEAGFEVVGLDLSEAMLRLARQFVTELPPEARRRIDLVRGDMHDFDLGRRFPLVLIADNSFRHTTRRDDLLRCLACIRRHLAPGGRVLITERRFDPTRYEGGRRRLGWSDPRPHPQTGEPVSRRIELEYLPAERRIHGRMIYRTVHADGGETIVECPNDAIVLSVAEYVDLFAEAGFDTRVCAGYREQDDDPREPILCFVCRQHD
jgi:SAM-dependent methyltransferase